MPLIQPIHLPESFMNARSQRYQLSIYRGDLEHCCAPGNKWHKLKYHLQEASRQNADYIATFGGPFSNHLHAIANVLHTSGQKLLAIVRGELFMELTPTLVDMVSWGAELWPSSRQDYRLGLDSEVVKVIHSLYDNVYWIPEGGGGVIGSMGTREWANNIARETQTFDAWAISAGTGVTASGFLAAGSTPFLHIFSALKGAKEQQREIEERALLLQQQYGDHHKSLTDRFCFYTDAHEGGYAKQSQELTQFLFEFSVANPGVILDPVYTAKSLFAISKKMMTGLWPHQKTLFIHTGGIQGWRGYPDSVNPYLPLCSRK